MSTKTDKPGALAAARAKLAQIAAERERLPRAVCFICGGIVPAGQGRSNGSPARKAVSVDNERKRAGLPPLVGWSRAHETCFDDVVIVRTVTGLTVSREVATLAVREARIAQELGEPFATPGQTVAVRPMLLAVDNTEHDNDGWRGDAWAHMDDSARADFAAAVKRAERSELIRTTPMPCVDGPCGSCGVAESLQWWESPMTWRDGKPAPWCAECGKVAERRPHPSNLTAMRAIAIEALSGASGLSMGERFGDFMRMFCELVDSGHTGTPERWTYAADAWGEVREAARLALPSSLPTELADIYRSKARAIAKQIDTDRRAAMDADTRAAGWPI